MCVLVILLSSPLKDQYILTIYLSIYLSICIARIILISILHYNKGKKEGGIKEQGWILRASTVPGIPGIRSKSGPPTTHLNWRIEGGGGAGGGIVLWFFPNPELNLLQVGLT